MFEKMYIFYFDHIGTVVVSVNTFRLELKVNFNQFASLHCHLVWEAFMFEQVVFNIKLQCVFDDWFI